MMCRTCDQMMTSENVCPRCAKSSVSRWEVQVEVPRAKIIEAARVAIGWPFRHRGRDERGIDCVGLLLHIAEETGLVKNLNLPDYYKSLDYSRLPVKTGPDAQWMLRELAASAKRIRIPNVAVGDIVYCRNDKWVHVGVVTPSHFIHAYAFPHMKVIETPYDAGWKKATVAAFAWPGAV